VCAYVCLCGVLLLGECVRMCVWSVVFLCFFWTVGVWYVFVWSVVLCLCVCVCECVCGVRTVGV